MFRAIRKLLGRPSAGIALIAVGIALWSIVVGVVLIDSLGVPPAPTPTVARAENAKTATLGVTYVVVVPSPNLTLPQTATPVAVSVNTTPIPPPPGITPPATDASTQAVPAPAASVTPDGKCPPPAGWVAYQVEPGDTLFGFQLGSDGQVTVDSIMKANCLTSKLLSIGQVLFLPPGVADKSPKVDDGPVALPSGSSRTARCPCTIMVRSGLRVEQIAAAIDSIPVGFSGQDFLATVAPGAPVPALGFLSSRPGGRSLEGFMLPGTYTLENNTSALQFRDMMLNAFGAAVSAEVQAAASARGLTFYQAVVLASIVQREAYAASEQKMVASVFHNNLAAGNKLGATVTIQYVLGTPSNWWPRVTNMNVNSPYNTYLNPGLPPGPICSPGLDAILAAVYPAQTGYLFFNAKCGGGNFYARTYAEFLEGLKCDK